MSVEAQTLKPKTSKNAWTVAALLFGLVFSVHLFSPNATPFDSRWTVHTAHSVLHRGNVQLDPYAPALAQSGFYATECVTGTGQRIFPVGAIQQCAAGHFYNFYPVGVALFAVPELFAIEGTVVLGQPFLRPITARMADGPRRQFLTGDFIASSTVIEVLIASWIVAATTVVMYGIAREFFDPWRAAIPALLFAFCTQAWSTGSRALWQHTPSMFLIALALYLALRSETQPRSIRYLGAVLMLAFFVRPTNIVPLLCFTGFVAQRHRKLLVPYLAGMTPVLFVFVAMAWSIYGSVMAPYFFISRSHAPGLSLHREMLVALAGQLISPGRGLFVFVPLFFFSVYGMFRRPADGMARALRPWLVATVVCHWLLISSFENWSGSHSFGPRYWSDLAPILVYFVIPVLAEIGARPHPLLIGSFALLAGISFFIQYRGATQWATMLWNTSPGLIEAQPWRLWDWRDLQFMRGLGRGH